MATRRKTNRSSEAVQGPYIITRRGLLGAAGGGALAIAAMGLGGKALGARAKGGAKGAAKDAAPAAPAPAEAPQPDAAPLKGRIKQSVSRWCFSKIPWDEFCPPILKMGIKGVDLVGPNDFLTLKKYGLLATMINSGSIPKGFNRKENHEGLIAGLRKAIEAAAENAYPNVICFSGNREGLADDVGAANCVEGFKAIAPFAEEKKVTLCMELLNSHNHKDYMFDSTAWGVDVCKRVGNPRMKILYDIYHSAMMGEDIIPTFQKNVEYIGHIHTGGYPGRGEIDSTQKLDYAAIMKVVAESKFDGWVAHEFQPKSKDPMKSLEAAVRLCDV
jgi:hydroxypyruvate isomerase